MNELEFALDLENLMRNYYPSLENVSDKFKATPAEALEEILDRLYAEKLIENVNAFKEEYNFGKMTLREYIETYGEEKVEELIRQIKAILENK